MNREIIDVPLPFMQITAAPWRIDWGGQSAGQDTGGGDQVVFNRFPRFVGSLPLRLQGDAIAGWRAILSRLRGRQNVLRLRMVDPLTLQTVGSVINPNWQAYRSGIYVEPRPQIICTAAAAAGATTITVDETTARAPVPVGAYLSFDDWPFLVEGRSGGGAAAVLTVAMLRTAIPEGGQVDLIPRGLFGLTTGADVALSYGRQLVARPQLDLQEWITR